MATLANTRPEIQAILRYKQDPVAFVRECLQTTPRPWQEDFLYAVRDNTRIAARSGNGVGKTAVVSWIILWGLLTQVSVQGAVVAPSLDQMNQALWPRLGEYTSKLPKELRREINLTNERIELTSDPNTHFFIKRAADKTKPEAMAGIHDENNTWFITDEASGIEDIVFEKALGVMTSGSPKLILISNPTRNDGFFFRSFHDNATRWKLFHVTSYNNPDVSQEFFVDTIRDEYGEDSPQWAYMVEGNFPSTIEGALIPRSWIDTAVDREITPYGDIVWGFDPATGGDRCSLCKRKGNTILEPVQNWHEPELMASVGRIVDEYNETPKQKRPKMIYVDSIGIGSGVVSRLKEQEIPVRGVNVAEASSSKQRYTRLRDQLYWTLRKFFQEKDCSIPNDRTLIADLVPLKQTVTSNGKILIESKKELKKRIGRSPDAADSLMLTMLHRDISLPERDGTSTTNRKKNPKPSTTYIV